MSITREQIVLLIFILLGTMIISTVHKMYVFYGGKWRRRKHHHHHHPHRPPIAKGLILSEVEILDSNNNSITKFKGNIMSIALVGKQTVPGTLVPIDINGSPIDLTKWPLDQIIQPGSLMYSSSDLALFGVQPDPSDPTGLNLIATSTGDIAGTGVLTFLGRNINGDTISGSDTVVVTLPEPTTSTSTSTTTTEAPEVAPLAAGFQLNWGTPTDVVS